MSSEYKGVTLFKRDSRWRAPITRNDRNIHLGLFPAPREGEVEAARASDKAAIKLLGEFALLNFPLPACRMTTNRTPKIGDGVEDHSDTSNLARKPEATKQQREAFAAYNRREQGSGDNLLTVTPEFMKMKTRLFCASLQAKLQRFSSPVFWEPLFACQPRPALCFRTVSASRSLNGRFLVVVRLQFQDPDAKEWSSGRGDL
jgi:hypothetical protein